MVFLFDPYTRVNHRYLEKSFFLAFFSNNFDLYFDKALLRELYRIRLQS